MARFRGMTIAYGIFAVAVPVCFAACGSDSGTDNIGQTGTGTGAAAGASGANANAGGASGSGANGTGANGGVQGAGGQGILGTDAGAFVFGSTQCTDGIDNDGDGLIDGFDPECTGPRDNNESSFATGIPGDNIDPKWQDCFFDGNSGAGDDGCRYSTDCLTGAIPQTDKNCQLTQQCRNFCIGFVPNGCDCFGCCSVYTNGANPVDIRIGTSCSIEKINDTTACPRCTKSDQCANNCGTCELCLGKTVADLPASCAPKPPADAGTPPTGDASPPPPPPPTYTCEGGQPVCSATQPCTGTGYCAQGCCLPLH